jgi:hypothetical protein
MSEMTVWQYVWVLSYCSGTGLSWAMVKFVTIRFCESGRVYLSKVCFNADDVTFVFVQFCVDCVLCNAGVYCT